MTRVETKLEAIETSVQRIESKLDMWNEQYVPRKEIDEKFNTVYTRIRGVEDEQTSMREDMSAKRHNIPMWVSAIAAVIAIVMIFVPHK